MDKFVVGLSSSSPIVLCDGVSDAESVVERPSDTGSGTNVIHVTSNETPEKDAENITNTFSSQSVTTTSIIGVRDRDGGSESCSTATSNQTMNAHDNPWPYIDKFFSFLGKKSNGKNVEFLCLLCKPLHKTFSTSIASTNNLKKHLKAMHPHHVTKFQKSCDM